MIYTDLHGFTRIYTLFFTFSQYPCTFHEIFTFLEILDTEDAIRGVQDVPFDVTIWPVLTPFWHPFWHPLACTPSQIGMSWPNTEIYWPQVPTPRAPRGGYRVMRCRSGQEKCGNRVKKSGKNTKISKTVETPSATRACQTRLVVLKRRPKIKGF